MVPKIVNSDNFGHLMLCVTCKFQAAGLYEGQGGKVFELFGCM